ncbi:MAG: aminotransferase class IV [Burkholderiaceae bacterium]
MQLLEELIERNGGVDMYVYAQITRGMEFGRNHVFPARVTPSVFAMAAPLPKLSAADRERGFSAITVEDFRWGRCDIKTTALLANVLMKQQAAEAGGTEAIIVRDGDVLEGAATSLFLVVDGVVSTPPDSRRILPGTTRNTALELATGTITVKVRRITIDELHKADEVWLSAATRDVIPVTKIDGRPVGEGKPGPMWRRMDAAFGALRARLAGTRAM